ncbi:MAG: c-type cytochrome [Acidiferrobacteraceae bacterium]|jgi:cytochrome c553
MKTRLIIAAACMMLASLPAFADGNAAAGKVKSQMCQACHGPTGNSTNPAFPRLAGQHKSYLIKALMDYRSGARKNPIMNSFAAHLTNRDIEDIAAYFSSQKGLTVYPPKH